MTRRQLYRWALLALRCAPCLLLPCGSALQAQNLLGSNPVLPQFQARALAWADYDGDGDQDLFAAGMDGNGLRQSRLLRNDGATTFVAVPIPVPALGDAAAAWGDLDGDGDLDLVASGSVATRVAHLAWYRNDGGGTFTVQALPAGGLLEGTVSAGDLDGDGDTDLLLTGWNPQKLDMTLVLRNGGGGAFTLAWDDQHPGLSGSSADIGDYDGDGDLDVVLTGRGVDVLPQTWVLRNQGGLQFYRRDHGLPQLLLGSVQWADYDLDGDLDILATGSAPGKVGRLYAYQAGTYVPTPDVFPALALGMASWGNIDPANDSLPDLVLSGESNLGHLSWAYRNTGSGFALLQPVPSILGLIDSHVAWADWNGDGYTDFVLSGRDAAWLPVSLLYKYNPSL